MTPRVLYIAGLGRSGSTLITRLMGQVAGVCAVGEAHHIWQTGAPRAAADELCGCGRSYRDCGFWPDRLAAVFDGPVPLAEMHRLHDRVARIRRIRRLERGGDAAFESDVAAYVDVWRRLYVELLAATGARVVLDASKDLGPLYFLGRVPDLEVAVVHLVRDPRAVAHSWSRRKLRPEFVGREVYMHTHGPVDVAWRWTYSNFLAERVRGRFPDYLTVRYEDFVARPREHLEALCAVAGLEAPNLDFLEGARARLARASHLLSGNPMRFDDGSLTIRPDTAWRERLPRARAALVGLLTARQRRRYGYGGKDA